MKRLLPIVILLILFCLPSKGQQKNIIGLIFKDTSNLNITKSLDHPLPKTVYLLSRTMAWGRGLFQRVDEVQGQVHEGWHDPYLFSDTLLAGLIPERERDYLIRQVAKDASAEITNVPSGIHLIHSPGEIKSGFFFAINRPLFTADKRFAFIVRVAYYKSEGQTDLRDMLFGTSTFVFQEKQHRWTLSKKINHLIL